MVFFTHLHSKVCMLRAGVWGRSGLGVIAFAEAQKIVLNVLENESYE